MPTYVFRNKETGDEQEVRITIAERDAFLAENPDWEQPVNTIMRTGSSILLGIGEKGARHRRPSTDFNSRLKQINEAHNTKGSPSTVRSW